MKKTDKLKKQLQDKIITMDELDITMEDIGYNLVEIDDNENNVINIQMESHLLMYMSCMMKKNIW